MPIVEDKDKDVRSKYHMHNNKGAFVWLRLQQI